PRGELVVVGAAPDPIPVSPLQLLLKGRLVRGHPSGTAQDVRDTMTFAARHGIRPMTEVLPLDEANTAYRKMMDGSARFRMVLTPS
ncbi:alcohol dehydrogenase, partial [Streptomyces sp. ECR3.8]